MLMPSFGSEPPPADGLLFDLVGLLINRYHDVELLLLFKESTSRTEGYQFYLSNHALSLYSMYIFSVSETEPPYGINVRGNA